MSTAKEGEKYELVSQKKKSFSKDETESHEKPKI